MNTTQTVSAADLKIGDTFEYAFTTVTVLRERESWTDLFGRQMFRYWAKRGDTGVEGWMPFGPAGVVELVP